MKAEPTTEELSNAQMYLALRAQATMLKDIRSGKYETIIDERKS